jgi:hypothetical protein
MYENLTKLLPRFDTDHFGEWIIDKENDGSPEHPIQWPYVHYDDVVHDYCKAIYKLAKQYPDIMNYEEILRRANIDTSLDSMADADVSQLDGMTVATMLFTTTRIERFCDGAILDLCTAGVIKRWLERLKEIDEERIG